MTESPKKKRKAGKRLFLIFVRHDERRGSHVLWRSVVSRSTRGKAPPRSVRRCRFHSLVQTVAAAAPRVYIAAPLLTEFNTREEPQAQHTRTKNEAKNKNKIKLKKIYI